MPRTKNKF